MPVDEFLTHDPTWWWWAAATIAALGCGASALWAHLAARRSAGALGPAVLGLLVAGVTLWWGLSFPYETSTRNAGTLAHFYDLSEIDHVALHRVLNHEGTRLQIGLGGQPVRPLYGQVRGGTVTITDDEGRVMQPGPRRWELR